MGALTGYLGQTAYNMLDEKHTVELTTTASSKEPLWRRALNSKYSPMKVLSDDQYVEMLKEKLLRVNADIAVVNDDIAKWTRQQEELQSKGQARSPPSDEK
jgi:peptide subunit release factor 1 (eRF1)